MKEIWILSSRREVFSVNNTCQDSDVIWHVILPGEIVKYDLIERVFGSEEKVINLNRAIQINLARGKLTVSEFIKRMKAVGIEYPPRSIISMLMKIPEANVEFEFKSKKIKALSLIKVSREVQEYLSSDFMFEIYSPIDSFQEEFSEKWHNFQIFPAEFLQRDNFKSIRVPASNQGVIKV